MTFTRSGIDAIKNTELLGAIKDKAQGMIKKNMFRTATTAKQDLDTFGEAIKKDLPSVIYVPGPLKTEESATRKLNSDYEGDWYGLKDIARCSVIAQNLDECRTTVMNYIKAYWHPGKTWTEEKDGKKIVHSYGYNVIDTKEVRPSSNACGYSGFTAFVRTSAGYPAEIQINVPEILFAKTKPRSFREVIGARPYLALMMKYQVDGGLGHGLYEIWRERPGTPESKEAAAISCEYYQYFRNPPNLLVREQLTPRLYRMRQTYAHYFKT
jgi:hypothetical protein